MEQKNSENLFEGAEVWVELEKIESPVAFPYKFGTVKSLDLVRNLVEVTYPSGDPTEKVKIERVTRFCQSTDLNINDMAQASSINKVDLLNNVKNRYDLNSIFTNVGDTLIIVNPYQLIPSTYTPEKMDSVIQEFRASLISGVHTSEKFPPHVFQLTMDAINDLVTNKKYQAIVISGESGAGKTETAKHAMRFITHYFQREFRRRSSVRQVENRESLELKILACNPVLEAFGNSKTLRNDNSSRFGKYIKIFVNVKTQAIVGAYMNTYLLEKSRVCAVAKGERNYHSFYQMITGINMIIGHNFKYDVMFSKLEEMLLPLRDKTRKYIAEHMTKDFILQLSLSNDLSEISLKSFFYLANDVYSLDNVSDGRNFFETLEGMINTGFTFDEIDSVIKITSAILLIGNIDFTDNKADTNIKCELTEKGKCYLLKACELLTIDPAILAEAITLNVRIIKGEVLKSPLKTNECRSYRDTFAKEIYNRLFNFLVRRMNLSLYDERVRRATENDPNVLHIGLLDIFGFECFQVNSFEQLCINYANEKLQQLYIFDIFKETERLFTVEGLAEHYCQVNFIDNSPIIETIGGYPNGIFYLLDNECNVKREDKSFLSNLLTTMKATPCFKKSRTSPEKFIISHTAKEVEYLVTNFVQKNLDEFKPTMKDSISSVTNRMIGLIINTEEIASSSQKQEKYLGGKFRVDMNNLMDELNKCVCHYIRCLKPNEEKRKNYFVSSFVMQQIRYLGILDTIRIRKEGYPIKKFFYEFYLRYQDAVDFPGKLSFPQVSVQEPRLREWSIKITDLICPGNTRADILFGNNLVLIRQKFYDTLDKAKALLIAEKEKVSSTLSALYRGRKFRKQYAHFKKMIGLINKKFRILKTIKYMKALRTSVKAIQSWYRKLRIKKYHLEFIKRMKIAKKFIQVLILKFKTRKAYEKVLKVKKVVRLYVRKYKHLKFLKRKAVVSAMIDAIIDRHIKETYSDRAVCIQKYVRSFIFKKKLGKTYDKILRRRREIKLIIACKKIQKNYRRHYQQRKIKMMRTVGDKVKGYFRALKINTFLKTLRIKTKILQDAYKSHYHRKHIIETRFNEFNEVHENLFEESNFLMKSILFPNDINISETSSSNETATRLAKVQKGYEMDMISPQAYLDSSFLKLSPFDEPKLHFFAHLLDIDTLINLDEIYEQPWAETYKEVIKSNLASDTPIQVIEVGGMHTALINSSGKVFTWGWNGNGQCGFKVESDKAFRYNDLKIDAKKGLNFTLEPNVIRYDFNTTVESNIDFNYENSQMRTENEEMKQKQKQHHYNNNHMMNNNNTDQQFHQSDFSNFYYIEKPFVIDQLSARQISCGDDFTSLLTKDNKLYVFGANNYYQLGIKDQKKVCTPICVNDYIKPQGNPKLKIVEAKSSGKNNVLVTEEGNLILLSHWTTDGVLYKTPKEIFGPEVKFSNVECGKDFCILLSSWGLVFGFGMNSSGQLGLGDYRNRVYPECVTVLKDSGIKAVQVSCGFKHVAIRSGNNKVFTWGSNIHGQLGNRTFKNSPTPVCIEIPSRDVKLAYIQASCGLRSTVFMTENRAIYWSGTCGTIFKQSTPIEFDYRKRIPELFSLDNHQVIKIHHSWCNTMSVLYAVVAETASLKAKTNNTKLKYILNTLSSKWVTKDIYPPYIESFENFVSTKHLPKYLKNESNSQQIHKKKSGKKTNVK